MSIWHRSTPAVYHTLLCFQKTGDQNGYTNSLLKSTEVRILKKKLGSKSKGSYKTDKGNMIETKSLAY